MRTMARLLYDFAVAENDRALANLVLSHAGATALEPFSRRPNAFAERAVQRIATGLGIGQGSR